MSTVLATLVGHNLLALGWIVTLLGQAHLRRQQLAQGGERDLQQHWTTIKRLELPLLIALAFASLKLRMAGAGDGLLRVMLVCAMLAVFAGLYRVWLVRLAIRMAGHQAWRLFAMVDRRQAQVAQVILGALVATAAIGLFRLL